VCHPEVPHALGFPGPAPPQRLVILSESAGRVEGPAFAPRPLPQKQMIAPGPGAPQTGPRSRGGNPAPLETGETTRPAGAPCASVPEGLQEHSPGQARRRSRGRSPGNRNKSKKSGVRDPQGRVRAVETAGDPLIPVSGAVPRSSQLYRDERARGDRRPPVPAPSRRLAVP
jgi:hypothetical protein